jgi:hypothetical protein
MSSPAALNLGLGTLPLFLPGLGVWRRAWGDGTQCSSAARHAANDNIFPITVPDQAQLFQTRLSCSRGGGAAVSQSRTHSEA